MAKDTLGRFGTSGGGPVGPAAEKKIIQHQQPLIHEQMAVGDDRNWGGQQALMNMNYRVNMMDG